MDKHLLNLRVLADATTDDYAILGFEGREEISQPFDYRLELIFNGNNPPDLTTWIGKLAEWDIYPGAGQQRVFAGRIYAAKRVVDEDVGRIHVMVRPAYHALSYTRATHFIQDKTSIEIFEAMTADVTGLVKMVDVAPTPPKRGYSVRYDESEINFLARLLAQDGIMYFFVYDRSAGAFRHKMIVTNKPAAYLDVAPSEFVAGSNNGHIGAMERQVAAAPRSVKHVSFNVAKLDTPFVKAASSSDSWGAVYTHEYETIGYEAKAEGDVASRQKANDEHDAQTADRIEGTGFEPSFTAGGRVEIKGEGSIAPRNVVLTSVSHSAHDPWMFGDDGTATYSNRFTAIDASKSFRPAIDSPPRVAPGPILGVVELDGAANGEIKVDKEWRIPIAISNARDYVKNGLAKHVWLPVRQQWAHSTNGGAQFFPRIGTRVIIDFLYGNPDLPIVTGTIHTPTMTYPFDPQSKVTQSGWRSITEKNGSIVQEFYFEDKKGSEEIKLYTGRDYRREIDQDDWGTVKRDQTLEVQRDRKRTVKGKETVDVTQTRTVTVTDKNLLESKAEVEIKVGSSSIVLKPDKITIKSPTIEVKADVKLEMSGGATAKLTSPKTDVLADAMLTLQGALVKIN